MAEQRKIPFNDSAVRAKLTAATDHYAVFEWCRDMEQWVMVYADQNIGRAVDFARSLRSQWWELREPVFGIAFEASAEQRKKLDQEKRRRQSEQKGGDRGKR